MGDQSRWSCKPALDAAGSSCSITYTLGDEFIVEALEIGESFVVDIAADAHTHLPGHVATGNDTLSTSQ